MKRELFQCIDMLFLMMLLQMPFGLRLQFSENKETGKLKFAAALLHYAFWKRRLNLRT